MRRRTALLGSTYPALGVFVSALGLDSAGRPHNASLVDGRVQAMVVDAKTHRRLANARVFVLSREGRQVAEARSDADGLATLPPLPSGAEAKYILAECPWYFIVGREWTQGQIEYYMPLLTLTPPGFSG
jgi:hypothetical protein